MLNWEAEKMTLPNWSVDLWHRKSDPDKHYNAYIYRYSIAWKNSIS